MGIFGSIFKSIVETATSGNSETVYGVSFVGFYDNTHFKDCFNENDGGMLIRQVCAFGLMRLIQKNELAEYKDDYISSIGAHMPRFSAEIARCIQEGEPIHCGVRNIVKFIDLGFSGDQLVRTTVQVEAESGHRITMKMRFPDNLFNVSRYSLDRCSFIPGFQPPSMY